MSIPLAVLIAAPSDCVEVLLQILKRGDFEPRHALAGTPDGLSQALASQQWDVMLAVDHLSGLSLERALALARPQRLPVLVLAQAADLQTSRAMLAAGAADVIWPAHLDRLPLAVERARLSRAEPEPDLQPDAFVRNSAVQLLVDPQTGQVVDANPAAAEFYGYARDQLRHMSVEQLSQGEPTALSQNMNRPLLEPGSVVAAKHRRATGELRDVEVRASLVQQGERRLLYSIINDVTDQRQRERELKAVAAFAGALRGAPSRAALVTVIVEELRRLTGARGAALALRDPTSGEVVTELAVDWSTAAGPVASGTRQPSGTGLAGRVIASGQSEWMEGEQSGPEALAVGVPLVAQGQTLGALCFSSETPPSPDQLWLLAAISDMAANALNRSTLFEQTEQRLQRLAALHAIDIAITASFDLRVTLGIFLDQLVQHLQVDAAAVLLLNKATQTLEYAATRGLTTRPLNQAPPRLADSVPGRVVSERRPLHLTNLAVTRPVGTRAYPPSPDIFRGYYGAPLVAKGRVQGVLEVMSRNIWQPDAEWVEFFNSLATQAAIAIDNAALFNDLQRSNLELNLAYDATIEGWSRVLEARGLEGGGHTRRVAELTVKLGQAAGFAPAELIQLRRGALLHDIGMLSIPEAVLLKSAPLSDTERASVQQHPDYGFSILAPIVYLRPALDIPYGHHERWDGGGYPRGLSGELIPPAARLFTVVDVWDALRSEKPYRAAWAETEAIAYLEANAGKQFDPAMVKLFVQLGTG